MIKLDELIKNEFEQYPKEYEELKEWVKTINQKKIPLKTPEFMCDKGLSFLDDKNWKSYFKLGVGSSYLRKLAINHMGYVLLDQDWIKKLANYIGDKRCLEVMAGCGSLTYALKQQGVNIKATDDYSWDHRWDHKWCDVEKQDACKFDEYDFIIMSWAYMDDTAYRVLKKMRKYPNCKLIYIGEDNGGCNADKRFFDTFKPLETISIPSWWGLRDNLIQKTSL